MLIWIILLDIKNLILYSDSKIPYNIMTNLSYSNNLSKGSIPPLLKYKIVFLVRASMSADNSR